jgi:hypothetical protein
MAILSDSQTESIVGKTDPQNLLFPDFALLFSFDLGVAGLQCKIGSFWAFLCCTKH